ncbi:MAG: type II secretion system F family protein, partial [Patescibacteria group bacterium]
MKRVVMQGNPMSRALEDNPFYFPSMIVHMIRVGEHSGNLPASLNYVGVFYEEELDDKMKNLSTILEPILLVFIGTLVAGTALAILGPIYSLT